MDTEAAPAPATPSFSTDPSRIERLIDRALALRERDIEQELAGVMAELKDRYKDFEAACAASFEVVRSQVVSTFPLSRARLLYIGALVQRPAV